MWIWHCGEFPAALEAAFRQRREFVAAAGVLGILISNAGAVLGPARVAAIAPRGFGRADGKVA